MVNAIIDEHEHYKQDRALARSLSHVWDAFFARHGRLTAIQRAGIPAILEGRNVVLCSPTASGKTEAACAPLVERNLRQHKGEWTILYISPTRALVNDLYARLEPALRHLGLEVLRRTGDHWVRIETYPNVLLTTPESFDSLMCRGSFKAENGHALGRVTSVVLDEIHLLHGSPRGEMLKWLLHRLRRLRSYAKSQRWANNDSLQVVALSATLSDPSSIIGEYLIDGKVVEVPGTRPIEVLAEGNTVELCLPEYISSLKHPEKLLVFCNSRKRADTLAQKLAKALEERDYVLAVHHGSLAKGLREASEELFHREKRIVVFATSTLELGIDIGDIDLVVLDGAPPDVNSLLQRIGRGNRRTDVTRVILCSNSAQDTLFQSALLESARQRILFNPYRGPHHSVALQQAASYVFQAPAKMRDRGRLFEFLECCCPTPLAASLMDAMLQSGELRAKGDGVLLGDYWLERADDGRIHSVIESVGGAALIDERSGQAMATGINYRGGRKMALLGKQFEVKSLDSPNRVVIGEPGKAPQSGAKWNYATNPRMRFRKPAKEVRLFLGFAEDQWVLLDNRWLFHFGGAPRRIILAMAGSSEAAIKSIDDFAIHLRHPCSHPLKCFESLNRAFIESRIAKDIDALEHQLGLPYASSRLPLSLRVEQVLQRLDPDSEIRAIKSAHFIETVDVKQRAALMCLLDD